MSDKSSKTMRVHKYIPNKLYGFAMDEEGSQVFFHLGGFKPGDFRIDPPPPPILGEFVEVEVEETSLIPGKAPKATSVVRSECPFLIEGIVETFDSHRGYGFVLGDDGKSYHLHKSEVLGGRIPLIQQKVRFYAGLRMGKPRACHVEGLGMIKP